MKSLTLLNYSVCVGIIPQWSAKTNHVILTHGFFMQLSKPVKLLEAPCEQHHTVQFTSDGMYIYWVYVLRQQETFTHPVSGERVKEHPVYLHTLELKVKSNWYVQSCLC